MLQLPKIKRDTKETEGLCKCHPVCKNRRRKGKEQIQDTSAKLLLKSEALCLNNWPKNRCLIIKEKPVVHKTLIESICQAPIYDTLDTPYLNYTNMAIRLGAMDAVRARCAFCSCGECCSCSPRGYVMNDAERVARRLADMREFDVRVRTEQQSMRIMYDKI